MDAVLVANDRLQYLVTSLLNNALSWHPWRASVTAQPSSDREIFPLLYSQSPSVLQILQEDIANLHGLRAEANRSETGTSDSPPTEKSNQSEPSDNDIVGSEESPHGKYDQQRNHNRLLNVLGSWSSPRYPASSSDDTKQAESEHQAAEPSEQAPSPSPSPDTNYTRDFIAVVGVNNQSAVSSYEEPASDESVSPHSIETHQTNESSSRICLGKPIRKQHRSLAEAPPLSELYVYSPFRSRKRPTAAEFFTHDSTPEAGEISLQPDDFSMEDIERLINEEKSAALLARANRCATNLRPRSRNPKVFANNAFRWLSSVDPPPTSNASRHIRRDMRQGQRTVKRDGKLEDTPASNAPVTLMTSTPQ
ncbi:MAG: hypothetical protein Q9225_006875, partial [Loekoesia sp. 1 TL-2023]